MSNTDVEVSNQFTKVVIDPPRQKTRVLIDNRKTTVVIG